MATIVAVLEDDELSAVFGNDELNAEMEENAVESGEDGATFIPAVAEDGTLSWTNDKGLENPEPVNIMGPQGEQGETGPQGPKGDTGEVDYSRLDGYVKKSGDTMTGRLGLKASDNYPTLQFLNSDGETKVLIQPNTSTGRINVISYAVDGTNFYEDYQFPAQSTGLTANKYYNILTSKTPVTVAQGGTGATAAAAALANLGGVSITKLWENASPTSSFAAQTISVDLSDADLCMIVFVGNIEDQTTGTEISPIGDSVWLNIFWNYRHTRTVKINSNSIEFKGGYSAAVGAQMSSNNTVCVPKMIFKIKGVQ